MNSICNKSYTFQLLTSSSFYRGYIKSLSQTTKLRSYGSINKSTCSCLLLLHIWCKKRQDSKLHHHLKKELLQVDISIKEKQHQQLEFKKCPKCRSKKNHFNTAEDHHRQLYENSIVHYQYGFCEKLFQFARLHEILLKQSYFKGCIYFCKLSLCCELDILKELKYILGENIDFPPLKRRVINHFCNYILLWDPSIKVEIIVSFGLMSKDLYGLLSHFRYLPYQLSSGKSTKQANFPSKFDIDPEYVEEESEEQMIDYWYNHFYSQFESYQRQMKRLKEGNKVWIIMSQQEMYEEMLEQLFDRFYN